MPERLVETCTACASDPCGCKSDIKLALETLDDLLSAPGPLDPDDLDAIETWADNAILDTMRHRRLLRRKGGSDA